MSGSCRGFLMAVSLACFVSIACAGETSRPEVPDQSSRPFSFQREVGAVFTRYGCNAAECHGGVKGRGGFKLSLGGLYPQQDHHWITRGGDYLVLTDKPGGEQVPRIDLKHPEQSLLLLKPTEQVDHEGGQRFEKDSPAYRTLLNWIERGAPLSEPGAERFRIERIAANPQEVVVRPGDEIQVRVTAELAGGMSEDITGEVHFAVNNQEVASVDLQGLVTGHRSGETDLLIRAAGKATSLRVGVIHRRLEQFHQSTPTNYIDEHIFAKLRRFHMRPAPPSSHAEFLRRVCLDLTGILPPPERVREFIADDNPRKRDRLIDILLDSPEFVDFWTFRFADLFRVNDSIYWMWLRDSIASGKSYKQIATERISAVGTDGPARFYGVKIRPMSDTLSEDVKLFLGRRLDCAQCHDHPWDTWTQNQFWGMAAFYAELTVTEWIDNQVVYDDPEGQEIDWGVDGIETLRYHQPIHPRTRKLVAQKFMVDSFSPAESKEKKAKYPRQRLATLITEHPYFAEAIVNRMWSYFFHRGFVEPVDHFSSVNPPSHPDLLAALAEDLRKNGYDLKALMRTIVRSQTYQLSATPDESNRLDETNFSHPRPRPLLAEVLLDAIAQVVGVPFVFERKYGSQAPAGRRAIQLRIPHKWKSRFLEVYNRPFRQTLPARDKEPNLQQAMHMLVGETYNENLSAPDSRLDKLLDRGASNREIVDELYLAALARPPSDTELEAILAQLRQAAPIVDNDFFTQTKERRAAVEDLLWAILCSREFAYNH